MALAVVVPRQNDGEQLRDIVAEVSYSDIDESPLLSAADDSVSDDSVLDLDDGAWALNGVTQESEIDDTERYLGLAEDYGNMSPTVSELLDSTTDQEPMQAAFERIFSNVEAQVHDSVREHGNAAFPTQGLMDSIDVQDAIEAFAGDVRAHANEQHPRQLLQRRPSLRPPPLPAFQGNDDGTDDSDFDVIDDDSMDAVTQRLEQAVAYLDTADPVADPLWHERLAVIEVYEQWLSGYRPAISDNGLEINKDDGTEGSEEAADTTAALTHAEQDVREAAAKEAAEAAEEGDDVDGDDETDSLSAQDEEPPILSARQFHLLQKVRVRLRAHRAFLARRAAPRANIIRSPEAVSSHETHGQDLEMLLMTSGRSFAARLLTVADAEGREAEHQQAQTEDDDILPGMAPFPDFSNTAAASLEANPYTVQMARYRRLRRHWMDEARTAAEQELATTHLRSPVPTLPPFEGAYAAPLLPPALENERRMLGLMHDLGRLLLRTLDVAPRPLLADVHRYVEQGLRDEPRPGDELTLRDGHDWMQASGRRTIRPLTEREARWLQFLLSDSTSPELAAPLPEGTDPEPGADEADIDSKRREEGSRALFHTFARRFQALLDDRRYTAEGDENAPLFRTVDTAVPVTTLVAALKRGLPAETPFTVYDVVHFLQRLHRAGRCRFSHAPLDETHGYVQRPVLAVHPEHRIRPWAPVRRAVNSSDEDDMLGAPRRTRDIDASWAETIDSGRADEPVPEFVRTFFCALAFRFGHTLRLYEISRREHWERYLRDTGGSTAVWISGTSTMEQPISTWHSTFERLLDENGVFEAAEAAGIPTSLAEVVQRAEGQTDFAQLPATLSEDDARNILRHNLLVEAALGYETPLAAQPQHAAALWDWAQPAVVGTAPQNFFHMDRWPLHLQTARTAAAVRRQGRSGTFDPEQLWDPASEDPTDPDVMWRLPTAQPRRAFGFQRTQDADLEYRLGESALQRQAVIQALTLRVAAELGLVDIGRSGDGRKKRGGWLRGWLGLGGRTGEGDKGEDEDDEDGEDEEDAEIDGDDGLLDSLADGITLERSQLPQAPVTASRSWNDLAFNWARAQARKRKRDADEEAATPESATPAPQTDRKRWIKQMAEGDMMGLDDDALLRDVWR